MQVADSVTIGASDLAGHLLSLRDQLISLWSLYSIVALGIATIWLSEKAPSNPRARRIIAFIFFAFSAGNAWTIYNTERVILEIASQLRTPAVSGRSATIFAVLHTTPPIQMMVYHAVFDVVVIWVIIFFRSEAGRKSAVS
jgi:hypothetical protein